MNKIRQKLTSQSGASITYALLLFLVCAVVSSVVLAAGTAASGRMSRAVESDERFFAVSSAAEYLKNLVDGKSVTMKTSKGITSFKGAREEELPGVISKDAVDFLSGEEIPDKDYTISADGEGEITVGITTKMEPFPGTEESGRDILLKMQVYNIDEDDGNRFLIELAFTPSIESRTFKSGTTSQKVRWSFYSIRTGTSETETSTPPGDG